MASVYHGSFTGGELSPNLYSRVDLARWGNSLKVCRNFFTMPYGGTKNRAGLRFLAETQTSWRPSRLIPFRFNTEQNYALEFGHFYMRIFMRVNGASGPVLHTSGPLVGQVVEIATPYADTDIAGLKFDQSADVMTLTHPNFQPRNLSRTGHDAWTLTLTPNVSGPFQEMNLDKTIAVYCNKNVGNATLTSTRALWTSSHVGQLFYLEQRNYGQPWEVNKAVSKDDTRRSDGKYYKAVAAGTTGTLRPTHNTDVWSDGGVDWLYIHSGYGIARITSIASTTVANAEVLLRMPDQLSATGFGTIIDGTHPVTSDFTIAPNGDGYIKVTKVAHGLTLGLTGIARVTFSDVVLGDGTGGGGTSAVIMDVIDADTLLLHAIYDNMGLTGTPLAIEPPLGSGMSSDRWRLGAWGGDQGWPSVVTYHQSRRVFSATPAQPQTTWTTRVNSYDDFSTSVPIQDDDALTFTLASSQPNAIRGMISMDKLAILTAGAEWVLGSGVDDVITPGNLATKSQGFRGSSHLPPMGVGDAALYVQDKGQIVRDMGYAAATAKYTGDDLTVFADHLVEGKTIIDWAYQQHPYSIVWMVRNDGILLGMTYMREQQVVGWHRHDTDGFIESVCCISEDQEDALYFIVRRTIAGISKRYVERMETRLILDIKDAFFVDSGLSYDGRNTSGTSIMLLGGGTWDENELIAAQASTPIFVGPSDLGDALVFDDHGLGYRLTIVEFVDTQHVMVRPNCALPESYHGVARVDWAFARNTFSGLDHLEGKVVSILGDGFKGAQAVVAGGTVTLNPPAARVHIGLPITADMKTLSVNATGQETLTDKKKAIVSVSAQLLETRGLQAGRDFDDLYQMGDRSDETYDAPSRLQDGLVTVSISTTWDTDGSIAIRQTDPLPITITALIPEVILGGN